jgi:hypothetical protein
VTSSRADVGNQVYTGGLNINQGFFYVSIQEDGLTVVDISGFVQPEDIQGFASEALTANPDGI